MAINSKLPLHLSNLFTICVRFGVVPDAFCHGSLIPILKKSTFNPSDPRSYRPITLSAVFSKILEQFIIEQCKDIPLNGAQFGFISKRSTVMASSLAHDIGFYCVSLGSPVYYCNLDAEAAFDSLPHSVLLQKMMGHIPDHLWHLLHFWYSNMSVAVRWGGQLSDKITIGRGTKQGGLTSPLIFNLSIRI